MSPSDYQRLLTFFKLSGELKKQIRTGWLVKAKIDQPESVADHVFRTALIAMIIGPLKKLDLCKLLEMAILHDLDEVITGDLLPEEKNNDNSNLFNDNLLTFLPSFLEQRYSELYHEIKILIILCYLNDIFILKFFNYKYGLSNYSSTNGFNTITWKSNDGFGRKELLVRLCFKST